MATWSLAPNRSRAGLSQTGLRLVPLTRMERPDTIAESTTRLGAHELLATVLPDGSDRQHDAWAGRPPALVCPWWRGRVAYADAYDRSMWLTAVRYRAAQAAGLLLLSALITACAVFAPLYQRALEQGLLIDGLTRDDVVSTAVVLSPGSDADAPPDPHGVRQLFPEGLKSLYDGGSDMWSGRVRYDGVAGMGSKVFVRGPQDTCRGLVIINGSCPTLPYQVLVSSAELRLQGWSLGTRLSPVEDQPTVASPAPFPSQFTIVGVYQQTPDPGHWLNIVLEGRAGTAEVGPSSRPLMDDWVTPAATFQTGWKVQSLQIAYLLDRNEVRLDRLDEIPPAIAALRSQAGNTRPAVRVSSGIDELVSTVEQGQQQARVIVPLLMGQLAILALVVLALVVSAGVEQRRPELALAGLRGRRPAQATAMLLGELGTAIAAGVPVGGLFAFGMTLLARHVWLPEGVPSEVPGGVWTAAGLSLVAGLTAVVLASRRTIRETVISLLRRVPPRKRTLSVRIVDAVVVAFAAAALVTVASGNVAGPLALATPSLVALSAGLVLAHALVPAANTAARGLLPRAHSVGVLTAVQLARRPVVRQLVTIITVATALTVFASDASSIGSRNRDQRAQADTGAEVVLSTDTTDMRTLGSAVRTIDPAGDFASPVARIVQPGIDALTTLAVVPDQFARIALLPRDASSFDWARIAAPTAPDVVITGTVLSVTASDIHITPSGDSASGVQMLLNVNVFLAPSGQSPFSVTIGALPISEGGPVTLSKNVSCAGGCRLTGLGVSTLPSQSGRLTGTVTLGDMVVGTTKTMIGRADQWRTSEPTSGAKTPSFARPVDLADPSRIGLSFNTDPAGVRIASVSSTTPIPALVAGRLPTGIDGPDFQAAGLDGVSVWMTRLLGIPYAPGGGANVAFVSLDALMVRTPNLTAGQGQVWLANPQETSAVTAALQTHGVHVVNTVTRDGRRRLFDNSASAWGLQLALVVGVAAVIIAGLVLALVAATSWRTRARDYAALRTSGMKLKTLTQASVTEQCLMVLISVIIGVSSGIAAAAVAVPLIPFFTTPSDTFPIDTSPALSSIVLAAVAALVVLMAAAAATGAALAGQAAYQRLADGQ